MPYVIWSEMGPTWMPEQGWRLFLEQLGKALVALVAPHIQRRERLPHTVVLAVLRLPLGLERGGEVPILKYAAQVRNISAKSIDTHTCVLSYYFHIYNVSDFHCVFKIYYLLSSFILIHCCCLHTLWVGAVVYDH